MRGARRGVVTMGVVLAMLTAPGNALASKVRVVDDAGGPVPDVMVACLGRESGAGLSGPDGVATVPDACREVYCERGDLLNDRATIVAGRATCRVRAGVVMTVTVDPGTCAAGCYVLLADADTPEFRHETIEGGIPRRASNGRLGGKEPAAFSGSGVPARNPTRWTSQPVAQGHLTLSVGTAKPAWSCTTDLGRVTAGQLEVIAVWRAGIEVKGRVLDREGKPVSDVPLFVHPQAPPAEPGHRVWTCTSPDRGHEPASGEDGSFRLLVDPLVAVRIDAGWKNYPIGTASAIVDGRPDGEVILRLK